MVIKTIQLVLITILKAQLQQMIHNNQDVTTVNVSCITDMSWLFNESYTNDFNQDISGWDVVTYCKNFSGDATELNAHPEFFPNFTCNPI